MRRDDLPIKREDDRHEPGTVERGLMLASAVLTFALIAYVSWNAWQAPDSPQPRAEVVSLEPGPDGHVFVTVAVVNDGGVGLLTAVVEVGCAEPAPTVTFDNVPADGREEGVVTCPPGTTAPPARVAAYVPT